MLCTVVCMGRGCESRAVAGVGWGGRAAAPEPPGGESQIQRESCAAGWGEKKVERLKKFEA